MKKIIYILIAAAFLTACSKTKKYSKRLAGEEWTAKSVTIDGQATDEHFVLAFDDCDIYEELCMGTWESEEGHAHGTEEEVRFVWQFREKGKVFQLSNQTEGHEAVQASSFSGIYDVMEMDKEHFKITSASTVGYLGKKVEIVMERGHHH